MTVELLVVVELEFVVVVVLPVVVEFEFVVVVELL